MFSLICSCINGWVNNGDAGDLRCHRTHYHVTVMNLVNTMAADALNPCTVRAPAAMALTIWDKLVLGVREERFKLFVSYSCWEMKNMNKKIITSTSKHHTDLLQTKYIWYQIIIINLTHWGQMTHMCVNKQTIIGSDNGLLPGQRQAIIWTNAGILLIGPLGTNVSETSVKFIHFHSRKLVWKRHLWNGGHFVLASMC